MRIVVTLVLPMLLILSLLGFDIFYELHTPTPVVCLAGQPCRPVP